MAMALDRGSTPLTSIFQHFAILHGRQNVDISAFLILEKSEKSY
ncbi:hypothetical protein [Limosilactobacillus difficilis]|nr:hypothetical protein [Limosilactobacillus difficilis]